MNSVDKEKLIQLSLFGDEDTIIDNNCIKVAPNLHDQSIKICKLLKKQPKIDNRPIKHECIYNISEKENEVECQILKEQTGLNYKIPPCISMCGTAKCVYYVKTKK